MGHSTDPLAQLAAAGQHHIVRAYHALPSNQQAQLLAPLAHIDDPARLVATVQAAIRHSASLARATRFAQLPASSTASTLDHSAAELAQWRQVGLNAVARNEVAVVLLAGGQGTRLGLLAPKGCFDVALPSHRSLFQIQAEKIRRVEQLALALATVQWYIMTLGATREATERFFAEHKYFGLRAAQVTFFNQGTLPCFLLDGTHMLMASPAALCESPDGNGGLYKALQRAHILADMRSKGVKHVHMYCVDNCLVKVADPVFLGFAMERGFAVATKAVRKRDAAESVGLIVLDDVKQKPCVIEYSEITRELAETPDPADPAKLYLRAANIVNHYYSVDVLEAMLDTWTLSQEHLPFHIARKKIAAWDEATGEVVTPAAPNGIKLEQFIFDVFPLVPLAQFGCLEVDRAEEFSPLKNANGAPNDTPDTCRRSYLELGTRWVREHGGIVPEGALVEVSSLASYAGEALDFVKGREFKDGDVIEAEN